MLEDLSSDRFIPGPLSSFGIFSNPCSRHILNDLLQRATLNWRSFERNNRVYYYKQDPKIIIPVIERSIKLK